MNIVLALVLALAATNQATAQSKPKEILALYVVAFNEHAIALEYLNRLNDVRPDEARHIRLPARLDAEANYFVTDLEQSFLGFALYGVCTYDSHSDCYLVGVSDEHQVLKLAGFSERIHVSGDTTAFHSYNDALTVAGLDLHKTTDEEIRVFVRHLIAYSLNIWRPSELELQEIAFTRQDGTVVGTATTREALESPYSFDAGKHWIRNWSFELPDTGTISLRQESKNVEQTAH